MVHKIAAKESIESPYIKYLSREKFDKVNIWTFFQWIAWQDEAAGLNVSNNQRHLTLIWYEISVTSVRTKS